MLDAGVEQILQQLQDAYLFADSKHVVDMPLKVDGMQLRDAFEQLARQNPTREDLMAFVNQYFGSPGSDLEELLPEDWVPQPPGFLQDLREREPQLHALALEVHGLWRTLHRKVSMSVLEHPSRHSLISLPNPFIVPGDRFRECYYWDSFWVVRGLLVSGMQRTAANIVENLLYLLEQYGHVPNGNRTYYLNRSQPPLLSAMINVLHEAAPQVDLLQRAVPLLLREHAYWTTGPKAVLLRDRSGAQHVLSRYCADWTAPRPESYREDIALAADLGISNDPHATATLLRDVATAAESGWDFSSRWFADCRSLRSIRTVDVVPTDLNGFLYQMERNIAHFATALADLALAAHYERLASARLMAIQALMWDEAGSCWRDLELVEPGRSVTTVAGQPCAPLDAGVAAATASSAQAATAAPLQSPCVSADVAARAVRQLQGTHASNYIPLWCGCCKAGSALATLVLQSLQGSGLLQPGGIATSAVATGQQWDAPNAWPPLQHMLIEGVAKYAGQEGLQLARDLAHKYFENCRAAFASTLHMHEKYDATTVGAVGGGGEYAPQKGFGWTNGVLLDLLNIYA